MLVTPLLLALLRVLTGDLPTGPGALTAAALLLLAAAVTVAATTARPPDARTPAAVHAAALRRRAHRTAYLPPRDPDAPGRPRPRAPGHRPAAA
ncbi:hypothetical protein Kpho02_40330 [Kitasatospora phosalacinea]|uniref:Uncharacterized protein n=1 Tax=Kitasatospora phosalacinea TaxID=2065 RepID=A0A9W6V190_9ACTN|nr:DUF6412 domain-containing protein [Kitasatospora phosalacinea]GLW71734.1 hypothetical protein Kpho02_40330 [Kitasatospora phosalacinea]